MTVFSPNTEKYKPEETPYSEIFHAVESRHPSTYHICKKRSTYESLNQIRTVLDTYFPIFKHPCLILDNGLKLIR